MRELDIANNGAVIVAVYEIDSEGVALALWPKNLFGTTKPEYIVWTTDTVDTFDGHYFESFSSATKEYFRRVNRLAERK